jgi:hypothetical protein
MLQAVKYGHLITWTGLTEDAINKHLKLTPATSMGHMNQRRQSIRSTSKVSIEKQQSPDTDLGTKNHLVYAVIVDQAQLYTDLTGKFPVRSSKGNSYVMLCYIYDCKLHQSRPHEIKVRLRMGQRILQHPSRAHNQRFQTKARNYRQQSIDGFKELLHRTEYRLSTSSASPPSTQRCGTRHKDIQRTLCCWDRLS